MQADLEKFKGIFAENTQALKMGIVLRQWVYESLPGIDESIVGGAKVKLALYSRGGSNNVLCGIQEGKGDTCLLYVHHIQQLSHERLRFSGKGKHAKRITFSDEKEMLHADIVWLLSLVNTNAPY